MKRKETLERLNKLRTRSDPKFRKELTAIADSLQGLLDEASSGGKARAKKLSKKRRVEIARNAAKVRWAKVREAGKR